MNNQSSGQVKAGAQAATSLIRVDQVPKLPHLSEQEKVQTQNRVQQLWDIMNNQAETDLRRRTAHQHLTAMSQQIMQAIRAHSEQNKTPQAKPQAPPPPVQRSQTSPTPTASQSINATTPAPPFAPQPVATNQFLPEVQQQLDAYQFVLPPAMSSGTKPAEDWLKEAKSRLGSALQRMQQAKTQKANFQRHALSRQQQGGLSADDQATLNEKIVQFNKFITESQTFLEKFREQQTQFRSQRAQASTTTAGPIAPQTIPSSLPEQQRQPANQASQVTPQTQTTQLQGSAAANPMATSQQSAGATGSMASSTTYNQLGSASQPQPQPQTAPNTAVPPTQQIPATPVGLQQQRPQYPSNTGSAMLTAPGPINTNSPQPAPHLSQTPNQGQMPRPNFPAGPNPGIQRSSTEPVLSAISGYVLDKNEEGGVLSKKKLRELIAEVLGANNDGLTPDAEELCIQFVDDFVDDLLSEGCKIAKLRGSHHLDVRDIQVVLERQYNMRIPGYSTDELRVARRPQPALGWTQKTSALASSK